MANRNGLRLIGFAYGGLTAMVAVVAAVVVTAQINMPLEARAGVAEQVVVLPR